MGFFQGNTNGFFQKLLAFLEGIISGEICFLPLETKKTVFHAAIGILTDNLLAATYGLFLHCRI